MGKLALVLLLIKSIARILIAILCDKIFRFLYFVFPSFLFFRPFHPKYFSQEWFTQVLCEKGYLKAKEKERVNKVEWALLDQAKGAFSTCFRVSLSYSLSDQREVPRKFFIKSASSRPYGERAFLVAMNIFFPEPYFHILQDKEGLKDPVSAKVIYADYSLLLLNYFVIAEDLLERGFYHCEDPVPHKDILPTISSIALRHAYWWNHPSLTSLKHPFIRSSMRDLNDTFPITEFFWNVAKNNSNIKGDPYVNELMHLSWKHFISLTEYSDLSPFCTLVQNDCRAENMFCRQDERILVDWQACRFGNGLTDVVYFMFFDLHDNIVKVQDSIIECYHKTLVNNGVKNYSLEDCKQRYNLAVLSMASTLIFYCGVLELQSMKERERDMVQKKIALMSECFKKLDILVKFKEWEIAHTENIGNKKKVL